MAFVGWTIDQWRNHQASTSPDDALKSLVDLLNTCDRTDPAWITLATPDLLKIQFDALKDKSVCTAKISLFHSFIC